MKRKRIWLVAWEASTQERLAHIRGPRILAFFDGRKSRETIEEIVFGLYLASDILTGSERAYYGLDNEGKKIIRQHDDFDCIKCGLNPWVVAREVEDFEVKGLENGVYAVRWMQPVYHFSNRIGALPTRNLVSKEERID